jgi:hypothetical protein
VVAAKGEGGVPTVTKAFQEHGIRVSTWNCCPSSRTYDIVYYLVRVTSNLSVGYQVCILKDVELDLFREV